MLASNRLLNIVHKSGPPRPGAAVTKWVIGLGEKPISRDSG